VVIQPAQPTSSDCLRVIIQGQPVQASYQWDVNGQRVMAGKPGELCGDSFKRGDTVAVHVDGAAATVSIGNSPPKVTGISATPKQLYAGLDVEVFPVAEDRDGDEVEFRYQWLINDQPDPMQTEARLPGSSFVKGDRIQVRITPYDGQNDGPAYQSYVMPIPNAPPRILTQPPQQFEALEYSYQFKASDPDGDKVNYTLEKSPPGMTVNRATGLISWPLSGVRPGSYPVKIAVRDPDGAEAFQEFTLTLGASSPSPAAQKP
jgi:hypothetical protein